MNTLVIVLIAAVCLFAGYTLYGRWLANKWGIDPKAKTPAVAKEDGQDYVPTDGWTVFAHQFSSIAGAGPVTGAIQAAAFGWLPVLLWVIIGGIFFGAVTDFGALLRGVAKTEIERGQVLSKPGSIHPHTKFVGQVYVLTKDEGGRHTPFFNNYRPQFYFRTTDVTGVITLPEGTEMCMPGDNVDMKVELITPIAIENGLRFAIREGGRTVGSGVVIEIDE